MRKKQRFYGPVYRSTPMTFTADDFEPNQGGSSNNPQAGQGGGGANTQTQTPDPAPLGAGIEIDVIDDAGQVRGTIGRPAGAPAAQPQGNVLQTQLDGDDVPEHLRGKSVSDLINALNAATNIQRNMPQPVQHAAPPPPPRPQVMFTEDDFGVTADPNKFQLKLNQFVQNALTDAVGPVHVQNMATQAQLMAQNARHTLPYYDLFKNEIEGIMAQQPVNVTANPASWQMVHDRFVRENIQRVIRHETTKQPPKPQPGRAETAGNAPATNVPQRVQMTEQELRVAQATGVDPREYVYYRDRY